MVRWEDGLGFYNTLDEGEVRHELATVPRLPTALRELPPEMREPEGSWQHEVCGGPPATKDNFCYQGSASPAGGHGRRQGRST